MTRRKIGRNERCPCGSGRKVKRCCGGGARAAISIEVEATPIDHPPPLLEDGIDWSAPLRTFEVVEVVDGLGYRVAEIGGAGASLWADDVEGSWVASPGDLFAGRFRDEASIRLPGHADCPLCQAERARRMAQAAGAGWM